ncbi:ABC1 kinase family protein [Demetria terragena]|uniref:ABC1 kinase family protein n=1 Tax=Demetria terragena TaxID=63959 RepID=UPI00037693D8|nr:AarF/UbiB family protein [Demetria terragena]
MNVIGVILGAIVNALLIGIVARRLLGVPVGWPRTLILSLVANSAAAELLPWALENLGLSKAAGAGSATEDQAVLVLVTVLLVAWLVALEVGLLAILEALVPTGSVPGPVELVRTAPARWRRTRRYVVIGRIAVRHGLGRYLTPRSRGDDQPASTTARALREALTAGGVTFVKLGQMLGTRPDVLPAEYIEELSRLHANVPPQEWAQVEQTLASEMGRPTSEVFTDIDREPLAAASVGQVHRATLLDGSPVVVKIQRSDARAQVTADLDIVMRLARWLQRTAPWARRLGVLDLASGFSSALEEELDYRVEASNVAAVSAALPKESPIQVPIVHEQISSRRVLVMDLMPGQPLSNARAVVSEIPAERRAELADGLLGTVLAQVLDTGVFHADLHAGNVLIDEQARLSLLDFGSVGRLDRGARTSLGLLMLAVDRQDAAAATGALTDLLDAPGALDDRALERDVGQLIMRFGHVRGQAAEMFVALLRLVLRHGLSVPPGVAAAFRSLGALEGTLRLLNPRIDLVGAAREQGRAVVADRVTPEGIKAELTDQLSGLLPMVQRLPRRLNSVVEDLHTGSLTVTVRTLQDPGERRFVTNLVQQLVITLLTATTALCGVLLALAQQGPVIGGTLRLTTYLGLVLLLFAFVLGCRAVVLIFRGSYETRRE